MNAVAATLDVARSHLAARLAQRTAGRSPQRRGRPPLPEEALLAEIETVIEDMPTYGYARVWARLRRKALTEGRAPANRKRVYRVMKVNGLLLERHAGGVERRHDGRIAVERSNLRWCSDGFEIGCDNGEKVRVAFALDCCDREAMSWVASTGGYSADGVRDVMLAAVEQRFGHALKAPSAIEWLTDNGSGYIAHRTRAFAAQIGLKPLTTPVSSPQSNGMAESFVKTMKRDYIAFMPKPDVPTAMRNLAIAFEHYNEFHPHSALGYRTPREFRRRTGSSTQG